MAKKATLYMIVVLFWILGIMPCGAQVLSSLGTAPDPEVLVSQPPHASDHLGQNMDISLVDIKAVDAPALHTVNGKTGIGSDVRYGQGIIINSDGTIATNRHIIGNAQHIYVVLAGGKAFEASVLSNSQADLCLIKINAPFPLRAISLADSSQIEVGNNVVAIANAGLNPQRIRSGQIIQVFKGAASNNVEILKMNIPLHPGDSGGPVLNEEGSLLGLIMAKQISDPGKSYAIASNRIQQEYFKYRNTVLN